jgi:hypothetical protein
LVADLAGGWEKVDIIGGIGAYDDVFEGHATQNANYNAALSHSELMYTSRLIKNEADQNTN